MKFTQIHTPNEHPYGIHSDKVDDDNAEADSSFAWFSSLVFLSEDLFQTGRPEIIRFVPAINVSAVDMKITALK